jgi:beta-lactamase regulating signal transducer with metallopeptidase domain
MQSEQSVFWNQLWNALGEPTAHSGRQWQSVLGPLLLVGITLALMRFMVGLWAVHKYRTQTQEIADVGMNDLLQVLRAGLGCRRSIELRESPAISSPATVGWHNPLILLPTGWINWTNDERRVVLAHEVAHVERGDYLAWLIAQFTLALHFYHPLVYWLAGRLRTDQEMAADSRGALVAGGPHLYLTTLAHIALREDRGKVSWAARPFIPMHGTFMRRIEMLRSTRSLPSASLTWYARTVLIAALLTAGILAAGLRGPGGSAMADDPPATKTAGNSDAADDAALSLAYVPADPFAVVKVRPADMLGRASVASLRKGFDEDPQLRDLEKVELVVGVIIEPPGQARSNGANAW